MSRSTPEGKVKRAIVTELKKRGVWYCSPIGSMFGNAGVPDLLCCVKGRFLGIEVKAPGKLGTVTALQEEQIRRIIVSGGTAILADSVNTVVAVLDEMEAGRAHTSKQAELQAGGRDGDARPTAG